MPWDVCKAVGVKTKMQWRTQHIGEAWNMEHLLRKAVGSYESPPEKDQQGHRSRAAQDLWISHLNHRVSQVLDVEQQDLIFTC